jgi:hypothetical protein
MYANTAITVPPWLIQAIVVLAIGGGLTAVVRSLTHSLRDWSQDQFEQLTMNTKAVEKQVTPNGGNTNSNGDITLRLETKVNALADLMYATQRQQAKDLKALRKQMEAVVFHLSLQNSHTTEPTPTRKDNYV